MTKINQVTLIDQEFDPNCRYLGKLEFAVDRKTGRLKELHKCKNKQCSYSFCEWARFIKRCPEQKAR